MRFKLGSLFVRSFAKASLLSPGSLVVLAAFSLVAFQNCGSSFKVLSTVSGSSFCAADPSDAACQQGGTAVCRFNGAPVAEGTTVTAFLASTAAANGKCVSQQRTCTNGSLSGDYAYASCAVSAPTSCLFDGRTIASGSPVTAYLAASPAAGQACQSETRNCANGGLSGSYAYASCIPQAYASCLFNGQTVAHGATVVAYPVSSVAAGLQCQPQNRTCYNGTLSGSGSFASCQIAAAKSCVFNGQTIASGQPVTAYVASTVPAGQTCQAVSRVCQDGILSGTAAFASCSVAAPAACVLQGQTIANGASITRYFQTDVNPGQTCATETRVCSNGSLSGSATFDSCVVHTGIRLSTLVTSAGVDVVIPAGTKYEIDQTQNIGLLQVQGQLVCPPAGNFTLNVQGIQVYGAGALFQCGTQDARFQGTLNIRLNAGRQIMQSERSFVAFSQGSLQFGGSARNVNWFRLAQTAEAGTQTITMTGGEGWAAGDHIAIAPTNFDPHEAEEGVIAAVANGGRTITLVTPLRFRHWGGVQNIASSRRTWAVDESAEVINLTRNIRIEAPGDGPSLDYQGGHMMVMQSAFAYADAVELTHMGQMGHMARYPFHWHRAGDVNGQFIVNSSIHDSFQRCITVHGSNNALVQNNVCYDHFGHGYFLEDGNETGNRFLGNVGILTKAPPRGRQLLESDVDRSTLPRWAGPATYWISNPANTFVGNVAAGSEGSGFWNSFADQVNCDTTQCRSVVDGSGNVFPSHTATTQFDKNVARSTLVGMTWDGADQGDLTNNPLNPNDRLLAAVHYTPPTKPIVNGNVVAKNALNGIYFRGQPFVFNEMIFADNSNAVWLAYNQTVQNSAIIAFTANHGDADYPMMAARGGDPTFISGVWIYDGPLELTNVDFINFPTAQQTYANLNVTPVPFRSVGGANRYVNRTQGLTFTPEPWHRFVFKPDNWMDSPYTINIHDLDGTLAGVGNTYVVVDNGYNSHSSCSGMPGTRAMRCAYQTSNVFFGNLYTPFSLTRNDGVRSRGLGDLRPDMYYNKVGLIPAQGFEYTMRIGKDIAGGAYTGFNYQAETIGLVSPLIRIADVGSGCNVGNATRVGSIDQVRGASSSVFFESGQDVYLRMATGGWDPIAPGLAAQGSFAIACTNHPSVDPLASPLVFDADFYRAHYADIAGMSDATARQHWVEHGISEGRMANPTYSVTEYLAMYKDLRDYFSGSAIEATRHYINNGAGEGRAGRTVTHPLVYVGSEYQTINSDLTLMSDDEARLHWLQFGVSEGRQASNNFAVRTYLSRYPDVAASVGAQNYAAAINHYVLAGASEGRTGR